MADNSFKPIPIPRLGGRPLTSLWERPREQLICWRDRGEIPAINYSTRCAGTA